MRPLPLLRPICWLRGHDELALVQWEAVPVPFVVCSRCRKEASEEVQLAFLEEYLGDIVERRRP